MDFLKKLPTPQELRIKYPLNKEYEKKKLIRDKEIRDIFEGRSNKFLLIIGPCSADREDAVLDYVSRLANLQERVCDKILIIPRIYTNKPRTIGDGYKGLLHQPYINREEDLVEGVLAVRRIHKRVIEESGLFSADEMLYPEMMYYVYDLISYAAVGARSVENQYHRLVASGLRMPIGMKNPIGGDTSVMLNSIVTAHHPHHFIYHGWEVISQGNIYTHAILRGYIDNNHDIVPNYSYEHIMSLLERYNARNLDNPTVIIDCNHANSNKKHENQIDVAMSVITSMNQENSISSFVKGLMIESYIEDGCQQVGGPIYGKSITDPCLGWPKTEALVLQIAYHLRK